MYNVTVCLHSCSPSNLHQTSLTTFKLVSEHIKLQTFKTNKKYKYVILNQLFYLMFLLKFYYDIRNYWMIIAEQTAQNG